MSGQGCRQAEESGEGLAVSSQGVEESQAGPRAIGAPAGAAAWLCGPSCRGRCRERRWSASGLRLCQASVTRTEEHGC